MSDNLSLHAIPALADNYIWALLCEDTRKALIVDPGEAVPVSSWLREKHANLCAILITHHHPDHTQGVEALVAETGAHVYGPGLENYPIPCIGQSFSGGEQFEVRDMPLHFKTLHVPGHTLGAISYHGHGYLFSGDTLFHAGCGRIFEGDPAMMQASLQKLAALPAQTQLCCGHEYSLANLAFAAAVEPGNRYIGLARQAAQQRLDSGQATLPTALGDELECNPFLRTSQPAVVAAVSERLGRLPVDEVETLACLREWKNSF